MLSKASVCLSFSNPQPSRPQGPLYLAGVHDGSVTPAATADARDATPTTTATTTTSTSCEHRKRKPEMSLSQATGPFMGEEKEDKVASQQANAHSSRSDGVELNSEDQADAVTHSTYRPERQQQKQYQYPIASLPLMVTYLMTVAKPLCTFLLGVCSLCLPGSCLAETEATYGGAPTRAGGAASDMSYGYP